jgi:tetratricopeptide (TPR) repeat protein
MSDLLAGNGNPAGSDVELVCDALVPLLGFGAGTVAIQETYWAVRKLLERVGARRPLVVVFDDIQWGEATFLDLVEYLADWIRSAPVLLVCQARPELLDARPGWITPRENASVVMLKALSSTQTEGLIRGLVGGAELPSEARARIASLAEGNPLFVEETLRMLVDHDLLQSQEGRWTVTGDPSHITIPPTIHALLTARLDKLDPEQREVIERGSAVGRSHPEGWATDAGREAKRAIRVFGELGDERGLARAWSLLGWVHGVSARSALCEEAWSRAAEHARRAGNRRDALESLSWIPLTVWAGPTPADEGIRRCREVYEEAQGDKKAMSNALISQAGLEAGLGRFDEARKLIAQARGLLEEIALPVWAGIMAQFAGWTELLAGDPAAAERELRRGYDTLRAIGELSFLSTVTGILAEAIYAQGRYEEADRFTRISEEAAGPDDVYSILLWRCVQAKCLARQGELADALQLVRSSATLAETTDFLYLRWYELMSRAEVLRLAGRRADADAAARDAIRVAEQKGNLVGARLGREALQSQVDTPAAPNG